MNIYYLNISAANCNYTLSVNDFALFKDDSGLQLHTEEPFNHLVFNGDLLLQIDLKPIKSELFLSENVLFKCKIIEKNRALKTENIVLEYAFSESSKKLPFFNLKKVVSISKPNFTPVWTKGDKLELNERLIASLRNGYQKFWKILKEENYIELEKVIKLKEKTYSDCYGIPHEDRLKMSKKIYYKIINDKKYELFDFKPEFFDPVISCFGKVASLQDKDGFHPTVYLKKDETGTRNIPLYFSKIDGEFQIVL
jgi:hypothetical protein